MNKIGIYQIELDAHVGTTEEERAIPQKLSVDIELICDINTCSDDLHDTIDYDDLSKKIVAIGRNESFNLVETFAEKMAQKALEEPRVRSVLIRVKKCHPPLQEIKGGFVVELSRDQ